MNLTKDQELVCGINKVNEIATVTPHVIQGFKNDTAFYQFNNFQQLKILLKDENLFNLD